MGEMIVQTSSMKLVYLVVFILAICAQADSRSVQADSELIEENCKLCDTKGCPSRFCVKECGDDPFGEDSSKYDSSECRLCLRKAMPDVFFLIADYCFLCSSILPKCAQYN